jgi:hypothetical protein
MSIASLFPTVRRWDMVVMFLFLALVFTFEMLGVFSTRMITITQLVKAYIPMPCRIMVCAWLCWHFVLSDLVKMCAGALPLPGAPGSSL